MTRRERRVPPTIPHQPSPINHSAAAFTLLELLIVIAIIAILAALLMPALKKSKDGAKRAACMEHLKQVAVALLMLGEDNDGWLNGLGAATDAGGGAVPEVRWDDAVTNYLGNADLVTGAKTAGCPGVWSTDSHKNPFGANTAFVGYGYPSMHSLHEVRRTSKVFLVADCYNAHPSSNSHFDLSNRGSDCCGTWLKPRHGSIGLNFVFVDGHGEFMDGNILPDRGYWMVGSDDTWLYYKNWSCGRIWSD